MFAGPEWTKLAHLFGTLVVLVALRKMLVRKAALCSVLVDNMVRNSCTKMNSKRKNNAFFMIFNVRTFDGWLVWIQFVKSLTPFYNFFAKDTPEG